MKTEELFERAPVWKSIFKMCLPTVVVMLVMTVYNMADMVFVGQTGIAAQVAAVFARVAVFFIADDARHMDRRWRLHRDFDSARRKRHRKSQIRKRRMYAFKPCFRRPARRRRAPFPERLPALFRRPMPPRGTTPRSTFRFWRSARPWWSFPMYSQTLSAPKVPCRLPSCSICSALSPILYLTHFSSPAEPRRAGCRHRNGSRQCFNRARPAFLSSPPQYHFNAQHAQSIPHAACLP